MSGVAPSRKASLFHLQAEKMRATVEQVAGKQGQMTSDELKGE